VPQGKYYLGDAGYGCTKHVLAPYRGVRYHLKEQRQADLRPQNAEELFNLRHASLRNVIERIFGVVKRKFKILTTAPEYSLDTQSNLVLALTSLYNYIRNQEGIQIDTNIEDEAEDDCDTDSDTIVVQDQSVEMNQLRDCIAQDMWQEYCRYIRQEE